MTKTGAEGEAAAMPQHMLYRVTVERTTPRLHSDDYADPDRQRPATWDEWCEACGGRCWTTRLWHGRQACESCLEDAGFGSEEYDFDPLWEYDATQE